jgi:hypothetical protein
MQNDFEDKEEEKYCKAQLKNNFEKGGGGQRYFQQKQYKPKDVVDVQRSRRKRRYLARCYGLKERCRGAGEVDAEFFAERKKISGRALRRGWKMGDDKVEILKELEDNITQVKKKLDEDEEAVKKHRRQERGARMREDQREGGTTEHHE